MVKYSKYLFLACLLISYSYKSHSQNTKEIDRDLEISRITLENYLIQWDMAVMLNRIKKSEATYQKGEGITITIDAPNAKILINNQRGRLKEGDEEIMKAFYSTPVIDLQRNLLKRVTIDFLKDFYSYLPKIPGNEVVKIEYKVTDGNEGKEDDKSAILSSEVYRELRNYKIAFAWTMNDINDVANKRIDKAQFEKRSQTKID